VPMLLAGDEFLRTQGGNNNAWCQDNEVSWLNWKLAETNKPFLRFVREMIQFRKRHPALRRRTFFKGELARPEPVDVKPAAGDSGRFRRPTATPPVPPSLVGLADIYWHGTEPQAPDFGPTSRVIAFAIDGRFTDREADGVDADIYVAINGGDVATAFLIPPSPQGRPWRRVVDTSLPSPQDIVSEGEGGLVADGSRYPVGPFSLIVLATGR
jgi:isoamylase